MDALALIYGLLVGLSSAALPLVPLVALVASVAVWRAANALRRWLKV